MRRRNLKGPLNGEEEGGIHCLVLFQPAGKDLRNAELWGYAKMTIILLRKERRGRRAETKGRD